MLNLNVVWWRSLQKWKWHFSKHTLARSETSDRCRNNNEVMWAVASCYRIDCKRLGNRVVTCDDQSIVNNHSNKRVGKTQGENCEWGKRKKIIWHDRVENISSGVKKADKDIIWYTCNIWRTSERASKVCQVARWRTPIRIRCTKKPKKV